MNSVAPTDGAEGYRALVVDDEAALAEVIASYLAREGFEVHVAVDGTAALSMAREVDPDLVVLDIGLPGVDGIEVCRQLRLFSDAYVIMLTARDTEIDTVVGLSVGADDYVTKPFSPRELMARMRAMLRRPRHVRTAGADSTTTPARVFGGLEHRHRRTRGAPWRRSSDVDTYRIRCIGRVVVATRRRVEPAPVA